MFDTYERCDIFLLFYDVLYLTITLAMLVQSSVCYVLIDIFRNNCRGMPAEINCDIISPNIHGL